MDTPNETNVVVEDFCVKCGKPISFTAHLVPEQFAEMFAESLSSAPLERCGFCTLIFEGPKLELV